MLGNTTKRMSSANTDAIINKNATAYKAQRATLFTDNLIVDIIENEFYEDAFGLCS